MFFVGLVIVLVGVFVVYRRQSRTLLPSPCVRGSVCLSFQASMDRNDKILNHRLQRWRMRNPAGCFYRNFVLEMVKGNGQRLPLGESHPVVAPTPTIGAASAAELQVMYGGDSAIAVAPSVTFDTSALDNSAAVSGLPSAASMGGVYMAVPSTAAVSAAASAEKLNECDDATQLQQPVSAGGSPQSQPSLQPGQSPVPPAETAVVEQAPQTQPLRV